ncbi:hypothetical protein ELQ35_13660 [Peribacillus cavernae]|uniref:DUF2922 domain-containing protein n=1 Tax=Peribacillus cavernae TaxID=1674310 RepID=A0A3S0VAR2_9BACI|nr:hypothetical protein [Peribacillus cavernae]MDQ0217823.1 L-fucose mutarotase/ribose pyranase (RbsD/FucU family) [Peribacillus cavernae]RUQ28271.1 hypothetical protein ELQ35_13660 [Peribacillus cavernae]
MKLKVAFYFNGEKELSHEVEGEEDTTQMISNIQKHRYYNLVKGNAHYVVDTEKAAYFSVTELGE